MSKAAVLDQEQQIHIKENGKGESKSGVEISPEVYTVKLQGVCPIIFHRWDCAEVGLKGKAKKNSAEKKTDNVESYAYRDGAGHLGVPGTNMKACLANAARFKQDPRSPRKSAMDLVKAIIIVEPEIATFTNGKGSDIKKWDMIDMRRCTIQRQGITRSRPAMFEGWALSFSITVLDPGYIDHEFLHELVDRAGKFIGLCDHRPQYGRFVITEFKKVALR